MKIQPLIKNIQKSFGYLWLIAAALYLGVSAGQAVIHNYASQQEIQDLETRLADAQIQKQRLQALLVYYNTDNFKEKELRRAFLLAEPGEKVYALPPEDPNNSRSLIEEVAGENQKSAGSKKEAATNLELWWKYITQ